MTLPSLIAGKQKEELRTSLKKNYSVMQQAVLRMQNETGENVVPSNYPNDTFKPEFMKYVNVLKDCGFGFGYNELHTCVSNYTDKASTKYKALNKQTTANLNFFDDGQFILTDGSLYLFENTGGPIYITVDVNGIEKNPNVWGYDLFTFQLTDKGKLLPMGSEDTDYDENEFCSRNSASNLNGIACTKKALTDKDYWKGL